MSFNDHQTRLWGRMIKAASGYLEGEIDFAQLVGELEGGIDAGEFKDNALIQEFYDHWGPLEEFAAVYGRYPGQSLVSAYVKEMRDFLVERFGESGTRGAD